MSRHFPIIILPLFGISVPIERCGYDEICLFVFVYRLLGHGSIGVWVLKDRGNTRAG